MRKKLVLEISGLLILLVIFASAGTKNVDYLLSGLSDSSADVRLLSAQLLAKLDEKKYYPNLKKLLNDSSDNVRIGVAKILAGSGDSEAKKILFKYVITRPQLAEKPTIAERVRALNFSSWRSRAALIVGEIGLKEGIPYLKQASTDEDGRVADSAKIALAKLGDLSYSEIFISALESTNQLVRAKAVEAIGIIQDKRATFKLRKLLNDWDSSVKINAILVLAQFRDEESLPKIRELAMDKNPLIREAVARALGEFTDEKSQQLLKKMLGDENGLVRLAAVESLNKNGDNSGHSFLWKAIKSTEKEARYRALDILESMLWENDRTALGEVLFDSDPLVKIRAAYLLEKLGKK